MSVSVNTDQGIALVREGRFAEAANLFSEVARRTPLDALAYAGLGHCLVRLARDDEAWEALETACRLSNRVAQAFSDLAWLALKRGKVDVALDAAQSALSVDANDANAHFVSARCLFERKKYDEADAAFASAAHLQPHFASARYNLGNAAFDANDFISANRHYAAHVRMHPHDVQGWINYGLSLARANDFAQARIALEKASALAPDRAKPVMLLAAVLRECHASDAELIPVLLRAAALSPDTAALHLQLACALANEDRLAEAHVSLDRVLKLEPDNLTAKWLRFQLPENAPSRDSTERDAFLARWRGGIAEFEQLDFDAPVFAAQAHETLTSATNFYLAYLGRPFVDEQVRHGAILHKLARAAYPTVADIRVLPIGRKRRRVAVFSASLKAHSASLVWSPALLALDPAEFELAAFYPDTIEDLSTRQWRDRATRFEAGIRSVPAWIDALRDFAPDVVIFLDIGMNRIVQALASLRHAPVQVTTWAHPVTSGMPTIDYFLSADACETPAAQGHYAERLVRLPGLGTYLAAPADLAVDLPEAVADGNVAEPARSVRLLCAQSADKLHHGHDALFASILEANPDAFLDILCGKPPHVAAALADRMRSEFADRGVDFDARCLVHARQSTAEYHRFLTAADICLDSLDFSGCLTSLDALRRDLPIVTLPGELMRSRQTFAMLKRLDLDELIATDAADYVRIASRLVQDTAWRNAISERIRARKAGLYEDRRVVDALAEFLRTVEPTDPLPAPIQPALIPSA